MKHIRLDWWCQYAKPARVEETEGKKTSTNAARRRSIFLRASVVIMFAVCASEPAYAQEPATLLGTFISDPGSLRSPDQAVATVPEALLDELFDLPSPVGIESLLAARTIDLTRRGSKEVAINRRVAPATVFIQQGNSTCTGSLISADGKILTCWHCVRGKGSVSVRLHPANARNQLVTARVLRTDPGIDLALLQLVEPRKDLRLLALGKAEDIQVGADVYAVGHPSGLNWSFVKGLISQVYEKRVWDFDRNRHEAEVIQSQLALYEGNSGGPLVSERGQLIGVNASKREGEQFTFAISLAEVRRFLGDSASAPAAASVARAEEQAACKRSKIAEGRNPDNTGTLTLYDTNCDGKADVQLMVPDDPGKPFVTAKSSDGTGKVNVVRVQKGNSVSTYLGGKNRAPIELR